jgi:membrane fusion protein (multidrug efflux system)
MSAEFLDRPSVADRRDPLVVTIGLEPDTERNWEQMRAFAAHSEDGVMRRVAQDDATVVVLGPLLDASDAYRIIHRCSTDCADRRPRCVVSGAGTQLELFQDGIDGDTVYYLARGALGGTELRTLVAAAAGRRMPLASANSLCDPRGDESDLLLDFLSRLSLQVDLQAVAALLVDTIKRAVDVADAWCLFYDERTHTLSSQEGAGGEPRRESAATGLVGYVACTGQSVVVARPQDDPRYDPDTDHPVRNPAAHFSAQPVPGLAGGVLGVVAAIRTYDTAFSAEELRRINQLVTCAVPTFVTLLLQRSLQERVSDEAASGDTDLYRREALEHRARGDAPEGRLLDSSPSWLRLTPVFLMGAAVVLVAAAFIRIPEYATGSSVVRPRAETVVNAPWPGRIDAIDVTVGQRVEAGASLGRLVPLSGDGEERLWTPVGGVIAGIHMRPGQPVTSGDHLASIVDESAGYELVAFLPASAKSQIVVGMSIAFKIHGHDDVPQVGRIDGVGPVLPTATDASGVVRDLPPTAAAPVLVVRSRLPAAIADVSGAVLRYGAGMTADARVQVASEPALVSLMPALRRVRRR